MFRTLSAPVNIQLELTSRCNHNCIHCYNYWRQDSGQVRDSRDLDMDVFTTVEREVLSNGIFHITIKCGFIFILNQFFL